MYIQYREKLNHKDTNLDVSTLPVQYLNIGIRSTHYTNSMVHKFCIVMPTLDH